MATTFRIAARSDVEALLTFMRQYYEFDRLPFDEQLTRVALEEILADESLGRVWLIHYRGEEIGYLVLTLGYSLEYGGRDAFIDEVYIRATYRGKGVGKIALAFAEDV